MTEMRDTIANGKAVLEWKPEARSKRPELSPVPPMCFMDDNIDRGITGDTGFRLLYRAS
jgi:hypothetical protein